VTGQDTKKKKVDQWVSKQKGLDNDDEESETGREKAGKTENR
jgi:hypothetical protein